MAARNIGAAQAEALADGFLDSLGSDRDYSDFVPDASLKALIDLAAVIIENAVKNLDKGGNVSSGKLSSSITVRNPEMEQRVITLSIMALDYYQFVNKGVKGKRGGRSTGGYAFKYANPSKKMVAAIAEWINTAHKVTVHLLKKHSISKNESKNATLSDIESAYMIAKSIVKKGIKPTGFFDQAVELAKRFAKDKLGVALKVDVIDSIPKTLNDGNGN